MDHDRAPAGDFQAHLEVALQLYRRNRYEEAAEHAHRAVELQPDHAIARTTLALIEGPLYGYERTVERLDHLLANEPNDEAALSVAIHALQMLERFPDALRLAERAAAVRPDGPSVLLALASCQWNVGRFEAAVATLDRAETLALDPADVLLLKSEYFIELGRSEEAGAAIDRVLAQHPDHAAAWYLYVALREVAFPDPILARLEYLLESSPRLRESGDRAMIHFALGKAYERGGRIEEAFRNLAEGNRLKRATLRFDVAAGRAWMRELAEEFSAASLAELVDAGAPSTAPIFVVGFPRSGTSLIEQILASHPGVQGRGELPYLEQLSGIPSRLTRERAHELGERYLSLAGEGTASSTRIVDKMPSNFAYLGLIRAILPRAKIIHCRRDPLDTCWSCYETPFAGRQSFAFDLAELGSYYSGYRELMEHWRQVLPEGTMLELDYEEVVRELAGSVRRLLAFCGLPWDDRCLRFYEQQRPVRTASTLQVRRPVYASSIGRAAPYRPYLGPLLAALAPD